MATDSSNFALLAALALLAYYVYQRHLHALAAVPGPFWASLSRLWILHTSWSGNTHRVMIDLHDMYGYLVRTAPNEVSVSDPSALRAIYGAGSHFPKSSWYSVWKGRRQFDLFGDNDEQRHAGQRKLVSRAYTMESLKDLEPSVDKTVGKFLDCMRRRQGNEINLGLWVQLFAFDIIGEVTFSKSFGFLDAACDDGSFDAIEAALMSAAWVGQMPLIFWLNDYLTPILGNKLALNNRHGSIRTQAAIEVEARMGRGSDRRDILSRLIAVHYDKPTYFDAAALTSMATTNIFAGSDTTAISIRAIIYFLLKNPDSRRQLVNEIDGRRREGRLSDLVQLREADDMPYLQAVMLEALRLHPAVGMSLPRVVPDGGHTVNGVFLPAGTVVGANPSVIHRDKDVFGHDADAFRPERWMQGKIGDMQLVCRVSGGYSHLTPLKLLDRCFYAFGAGARLCLGKNISWMEMSKLVPTLFLHFDVKLSDQAAGQWWTERCAWFVLQDGLECVLTPRIMAEQPKP